MKAKKIRQQFADTMLSIGQADPKLVVLIGDISHFILQPYAQACPGRFYNVGICEPTIVSMAAGLSKTGLFPVVHTIAPFIIERAFEQIKLDFCYQRLAGNLITVGSAFDYSNLGCTHHCYDDFALIKSLPNTQIVYPASCAEFDLLFRETYNNGSLTYSRIPEVSHGVDIDTALIRFGKAICISEGKDLTIIATGPQLKNAVEAKNRLLKEGITAEVIYVHTLLPLDLETINTSIEKTRRVIVIEEHNRLAGLGDDILRQAYGNGKIRCVTLGIDRFIHDYRSYEEHCHVLGLSAEGIIKAARKIL